MSARARALRVVPWRTLRLAPGALRDAWRLGDQHFRGEVAWQVEHALRGRATSPAERAVLSEAFPVLVEEQAAHWRATFLAEEAASERHRAFHDLGKPEVSALRGTIDTVRQHQARKGHTCTSTRSPI